LSQKIASDCNNLSKIVQYNFFQKVPDLQLFLFFGLSRIVISRILKLCRRIFYGKKLLYAGRGASALIPLDMPIERNLYCKNSSGQMFFTITRHWRWVLARQ